jgi:hypothetical protein
MTGFLVELPMELRAEIVKRAGVKPGDEAAWIAEAVREKLAAHAELEYLLERGNRGRRDRYEEVLSKVPASLPLPEDNR